MFKLIIYSIVLILFISCEKDVLVKPRGFVRLEYPEANYKVEVGSKPYSFEYNDFAKLIRDKKHRYWYNIEYEKMNATVYLSYFPIQNNLNSLLKDSEALLDTHTIKANSANDSKFENPDRKVYGLITRLGGETASNIQFHLTDSVRHFISGSLYFHVHPKPDSLRPAIDYIEKDIKYFAESLKWKNE